MNIDGKEYISLEEHNKKVLEETEKVKKEMSPTLSNKISETPETKKEDKKPIKRFPVREEINILKSLNEVLNDSIDNSISEEEAVTQECCVIDAANVCMVFAKSEEAKRVIARFISREGDRKELPKWDFISVLPAKSRYSLDYINKIMKIMNESNSEDLTISTKNNHPCLIENNHFGCVLAPRIEAED